MDPVQTKSKAGEKASGLPEEIHESLAEAIGVPFGRVEVTVEQRSGEEAGENSPRSVIQGDLVSVDGEKIEVLTGTQTREIQLDDGAEFVSKVVVHRLLATGSESAGGYFGDHSWEYGQGETKWYGSEYSLEDGRWRRRSLD